MESIEKLKNDLATHTGWPKIYQFDQSETNQYVELKEFIQKDENFINIILDGTDFSNIFKKFEGREEKYKTHFLKDVLYAKILEKAGISVDYNDIMDNFNCIYWDLLKQELKKISKNEDNKVVRIHIFLDDVNDAKLQSYINDFFTARFNTVIGYRSKELLSYYDSSNCFMQALHDYIPVTTDVCSKNTYERTRNSKNKNVDNSSN